ncbi:hypothetical protein [Streptomyces sp. CoH17]|uniref:hypothetical protein n=1 Tax=Streptomyces sp. CoH17 TaxID=2992806 RepID=UPI00226DF526|nr:hypothetical protein [Streptomyces sp. CoH17]
MELNDPASAVVREIQQRELKKLMEGWKPEPEDATEVKKSEYSYLFEKISYEWRPEDKNALVQLRAAASKLIGDLFGSAIDVIDEVYKQARVPATNEHGATLRDSEGRIVWKTGGSGLALEDWSQVTGQDLEKALWDLQQVKLVSAQRVSELFLEAVFAKHTYNDFWHEAFEAVMDGTQGQRSARANREAKKDKYAAYFRYYLWHRADSFQREITSIMRILERIIDWRMRRRD